jgi:hypothetical protein
MALWPLRLSQGLFVWHCRVIGGTKERMMYPYDTYRLANVIHQERLAAAAKDRWWAKHAVPLRPLDRFRLALSARLIAWGEWLQVPQTPIKAR